MFSDTDLQKLLFGRLTLADIPYHEPILLVTFAGVAVTGIAVLATIGVLLWRAFKKSGWL